MLERKETTHVLMDRELIIYRRERSTTWQCRYKVNGVWQRASTKERDLKKAKEVAKHLMIEAEIRKRSNLPVVTRRLRDIAKLAVERMRDELKNGRGKVIYKDYIRVIEEYLIPILGKRNINSIDHSALDELDVKRIEVMGKAPSQSTMLTHNAAFNKVLDEAEIRNFINASNRIKLEAKGRASDRRPAFELNEIQALLGKFDAWIERAKTEESKEQRTLMRDYVDILMDTGARPGKEIMGLKWKQIIFKIKPVLTATTQLDEEGEEIVAANLNRSVELVVSGKTGTRTIVGMNRTVKALERLAKRNYGIDDSVVNPFAKLTVPSNNDFVVRTKNKLEPTSFQKMFESYLEEHNLLVDPKSEQKRVFYSLRHTYATLQLTHDKVPIHTLAKQMGTSVLMIEKHYSHLKVIQAIEQLRGEETRRLIDGGSVVDETYASKKVAKKPKLAKGSGKKSSG